MESIRIGHISDLHLRHYTPGSSLKHKNRSREMPVILRKALQRFKNSMVDLVVITGDLVDSPAIVLENNDYYMDLMTPFREMVKKDYRLIRYILEQSGLPWIVLPGNCDTGDLFQQVFHDQPLVQDFGVFRFVSFHDRQWDGKKPRRFDRERRLMEEMLFQEDHHKQIHLQHYLIRKGHRSKSTHRYLEWENIRSLTRDSRKVLLSLSGHYPPGVSPKKEGITTWYAAPSLCRAPYSVTIHQLREDGEHFCTEEPLSEKPLLADTPVVFLDRDGVINTLHTYSTGPEEMQLIPGAAHAVKKLKDEGFAVMVNTNQSCIGLGYVPESVVQLNHEYMCYLMALEADDPDVQPDAVYYSLGAGKKAIHPSLEDLSQTKPSPALIEKAFREFQLLKEGSWMIGDREGDLLCGINGNLKPLLVLTGLGEQTAVSIQEEKFPGLVIKRDLLAAAEFIINNRKSRW